MRRTLLLVSVISLTSACGGDDDDSSAFEGIYELDSWTENLAGCDEEGPPAFGESMYTHFFVRMDSFFGEEFLNTVMCGDLGECRTDAADTDTFFLGGPYFEEGDDADGWTSTTSSVFDFDEDDSCEGTVSYNVLTGEPGSSVRIEQEAVSVEGIPVDSEGDCDEETAESQADGKPCEQLTVITGTFVEGL